MKEEKEIQKQKNKRDMGRIGVKAMALILAGLMLLATCSTVIYAIFTA